MKTSALLLLLPIFIFSCKKDPSTSPPPPPAGIKTVPTVSTATASSVTINSAVAGGNVTSDGGASITAYGICWGITSNPLVTNNHTIDGSGTGIFSSILSGLSAGTAYHLRAYATNSEGTAYGNDVSFTTAAAPPVNIDSAKYIFITNQATTNFKYIWQYNAKNQQVWTLGPVSTLSFWSKPAYGNNMLYMSAGQIMYTQNLANGVTDALYINTTTNLVNPAVVNDTVVSARSIIAPSAQNMIMLWDKTSGYWSWTKTVTDQPLITPLLDGNKIFCLTTNSTGTATTLSAYEISTKNLLWQKVLSTSFLMSVPPQMVVRNDTLIVGAPTGNITLLNKNSGNTYWSKNFNAESTELYNDKIVYVDRNTTSVTVASLQTGNVIVQSLPLNVNTTGKSYIYNGDYFFNSDKLFCVSLTDGTIKWTKSYQGYFAKFIVIDNLVYGAKLFDNANDEMKIMKMNAYDFTPRDSITVFGRFYLDLSILSTTNKFY